MNGGEGAVVSKTSLPITIQSMTSDLLGLGVSEGDTLLVHSSMSSMGWVCGGSQAVVTGLLQSVGAGGTVVMPAHSSNWSDPAKWQNPPVPEPWIQVIYDHLPPFEPDKTPTRGMGAIAETFRTWPRTLRSNHPEVSFTANGRLAGAVTGEHPLSFSLGPASPLGKLYALGAKVLLLGVDYSACTCLHLAESMWSKRETERCGSAVLEQGERVWKWYEDFGYCSDDFKEIGMEMEKSGQVDVRKGLIGQAPSLLFPLKGAVDFAREWMEIHRS
eukprot:TRINITY_DN22301_c0_g1_i1.p1 TRINITY_DN22301_c0_g1~~TRINITY_DN22301_c0_g1_i1.p1  ORF type:complete len:273 (+),score=37.82 TRINITY_DN22301_c0_g1_i1:2-820(+)